MEPSRGCSSPAMLALATGLLTVLVTFSTVQAAPHVQKRAIDIVGQCTVPGQVALTFDDGPWYKQGQLRDTLNGGKATFFLNGQNYGCIYDFADQMRADYAAGHTLGSHTWSHAHLNSLSWDQIHDELWRVEEAFIKILGLKPLFFRPPYGEYNDLVLAALENRGYRKMFLWTDDSGDANGESVWNSQGMYDQIANSYPSPHLVLNHETIDTTPDQLIPYAVNRLTSAGYQLVAVDTCIGQDGIWPYEWVGQPQERDASWHC